MWNKKNNLAFLIDMENPGAVLKEVNEICCMMYPDFNSNALAGIFVDISALFAGEYPGYRACNTDYHDLKHTTDTFLAMARIMHGASLFGLTILKSDLMHGLTAALFHDTGYIQATADTLGTGAKYTMTHVDRSIDFMQRYFVRRGFSHVDFSMCKAIVACTQIDTPLPEATSSFPDAAMLGKMLGTADLIGQMGDRIYLEKLLLLFNEFKEGGVPGYETEIDILKKTIGFFEFAQKRFIDELDGLHKYFIHHFRARYNIHKDLYQEAMGKNIRYLTSILQKHQKNYRKHLRRGGIVESLEKHTAD